MNGYHWPGNVRQLDNEEAAGNKADSYAGTMEEIKNLVIKQRLKLFDGNKTQTAKSLDISLRSMQAKAKELDL